MSPTLSLENYNLLLAVANNLYSLGPGLLCLPAPLNACLPPCSILDLRAPFLFDYPADLPIMAVVALCLVNRFCLETCNLVRLSLFIITPTTEM